MAVLRAPQVCAAVGVTYRQLEYWDRTNLVVPSVTAAAGSGSVRRYNTANLVQLVLVVRLLTEGLTLQAVRPAVDLLRQQTAPPYLIGAGHHWATVTAEHLIEQINARADGQVVTVVDLTVIRSHVDRLLAGQQTEVA